MAKIIIPLIYDMDWKYTLYKKIYLIYSCRNALELELWYTLRGCKAMKLLLGASFDVSHSQLYCIHRQDTGHQILSCFLE